ncbi:FkbM family methyltransferase [Cellulosilyticum sp. ST5]|uniref:FkbM family methyltransferase n=1 Tax=unclassified Cellulosilyticum TaxID=2643091 RepID=UPI000F8D4BD0|nr:FkbM family methyltransferase [Cellulosilyticum sp. WCF-2]QEH66974.1 FkbM family methyltransferase [Cellulosilyticum sp. WCF-2]
MNSNFESVEQEVLFEMFSEQVSVPKKYDKNSIEYHLDTMWNLREQPLQVEQLNNDGIKNKITKYIKKIIRKLIRWYVRPIPEQQTHFNNATFNTVKALKEQQETLNLREEQITIQEKNIREKQRCVQMDLDILKYENNELDKKYSMLQTSVEEIKAILDNTMYMSNSNLESIKVLVKDKCQEGLEIQTNKFSGYDEKISMNTSKIDELFQHINNLVSMYQQHQTIIDMLPQSRNSFNLARKMTYSQSGEDAILAYVVIMLGLNFKDITYVDLGANDPIEINNTYMFYEQGSRGILVEANPGLIDNLKKKRQGDTVLNFAIDTRDGEEIPFYIMNVSSMSTMSHQGALDAIKVNPDLSIEKIEKVQTITINTLFEKYNKGKAPEILNIDIEGEDMDIIKSIDFSKYRPILIVVEMIEFGNELMYSTKNQQIVQYIKEQGYNEYAFTGINSIFIDAAFSNNVDRTQFN